MPFKPEEETFPSLGFDVGLGASSTARGAPYVPPPAPVLPPIQAPKPVFNPNVGLKPEPVVPAGPDPVLQSYLTQQRERLNEFGPDKQMAMEQEIQKRRSGFVPNLANAGVGLADAIMQGVARAGSGNFQSNLQGRLDKSDEAQRQALERQQSGGLAKMKQEMELAQLDPASPLSRSTQRANMQSLKMLGYTPEDAASIPAASMPDVLAKRLSLEEIREKGKTNQLMAEQNAIALGIKQQSATQSALEAREKGRMTAAEGLQRRPWYQKALEIFPGPLRSTATDEMLAKLDENPANTEALDWVNQNINDPRVPGVLKKLMGQ